MTIHDRSLGSWLGAGTLIKKNGGVKLFLRVKTPLIEMMQSCTSFSQVSKMSTFTYTRMCIVVMKLGQIFVSGTLP
jgi:hypothetical protein